MTTKNSKSNIVNFYLCVIVKWFKLNEIMWTGIVRNIPTHNHLLGLIDFFYVLNKFQRWKKIWTKYSELHLDMSLIVWISMNSLVFWSFFFWFSYAKQIRDLSFFFLLSFNWYYCCCCCRRCRCRRRRRHYKYIRALVIFLCVCMYVATMWLVHNCTTISYTHILELTYTKRYTFIH